MKMKENSSLHFLVISIISHYHLVDAGLNAMHSDIERLKRNISASNRNIFDEMPEILIPLNYGCWCMYNEDYVFGKSKPVDQIDSYCRDLHNGYDCIVMDMAEAGNDACVPYEVDYGEKQIKKDKFFGFLSKFSIFVYFSKLQLFSLQVISLTIVSTSTPTQFALNMHVLLKVLL